MALNPVEPLVRPDGRIVWVYQTLAGTHQEVALISLLPDGNLDCSFGVAGIVRIDAVTAGDAMEVRSAAIQPDGSILLATGSSWSGENGYGTLRRFDAHGQIDTEFGNSGSIALDFYVAQVFVTPDQSILVLGESLDESVGQWHQEVCRFGPDGALRSRSEVGNDRWIGLAQAPDGSILFNQYDADSGQNVLTRLRPDGTLDTTFGTDGRAPLDPLLYNVREIEVRPDGRILLLAWQYEETGESFCERTIVARYLPDGRIDTSFGVDGIADQVPWAEGQIEGALALAVDQAGGIVIVSPGCWEDNADPEDPVLVAGGIHVVRLTPQGDLDLSFAANASTPGVNAYPGMFASSDQVKTCILSDGGILVGGTWIEVGEDDTYRNGFVMLKLLGTLPDYLPAPEVTDAQTSFREMSPPITIVPGAEEGAAVGFFKVSDIRNGTLFHNDGVTPLSAGAFVSVAEAAKGLRFLLNDWYAPGSFQVHSSCNALDTGGARFGSGRRGPNSRDN